MNSLQSDDQAFVVHRIMCNEGSRDGELEDLYEDEAFTESQDNEETWSVAK